MSSWSSRHFKIQSLHSTNQENLFLGSCTFKNYHCILKKVSGTLPLTKGCEKFTSKLSLVIPCRFGIKKDIMPTKKLNNHLLEELCIWVC